MKIINFGSINIDHVYEVAHFVHPGETLRSKSYRVFSGGKGANQSLSLARAGAKVLHAGKIGEEGLWLKEKLAQSGVDTSLIQTSKSPTGHALIQVDAQGENAIIIHAGANESISQEDIDRVFDAADKGDCLLVQNEINMVEQIIREAKTKGMVIVFNPAPLSEAVKEYPLELVDLFIINEVEGEMLTQHRGYRDIVQRMQQCYPSAKTVLTLGTQGLIYADAQQVITLPALKVKAADTTGAGDTFIGYFLAELIKGSAIEECLKTGIRASALCVTRKGAGDSIPWRSEVEAFKG